MRPTLPALAAALLLAAGPAFAQYDPSATRTENQNAASNRSMSNQQQNRAVQQQNQFENNSLRNELSRPAPSLPTPIGPGAPPTAIGR